MKKMLRWLCFSTGTSRIKDSSLSHHEQGLSDEDEYPGVEHLNNYAWVYRTVEYCCGSTADRESSLWGFVAKISALLADDAVNRVALWGLQGSGKSAIANTVNNSIREGTCALQFDLVIWVGCTNEFALRSMLLRIAGRLELYFPEDAPDVVISRLIFRKLQKFKTCLFIFDDAHKSIDLDLLGIPWKNEDNGVRVKILITTRDRCVCRRLVVDHILTLDFLSDDDAWKFFASVIRGYATSIPFEPIAQQICKKLKGYPFAIMVVGKLLLSTSYISGWKVALSDLKFPRPQGLMIPSGMIFAALKLSYDCLQEKMKSCFLLCALYPGNCLIKVKEVVCHMVAKGIIEDCEGLILVQGLKDVCLLEDGLVDETVTMHQVIHDFAQWLMSTTNEGEMYGYSLQNIELQVKIHSSP